MLTFAFIRDRLDGWHWGLGRNLYIYTKERKKERKIKRKTRAALGAFPFCSRFDIMHDTQNIQNTHAPFKIHMHHLTQTNTRYTQNTQNIQNTRHKIHKQPRNNTMNWLPWLAIYLICSFVIAVGAGNFIAWCENCDINRDILSHHNDENDADATRSDGRPRTDAG
jgi:hypothetical protein